MSVAEERIAEAVRTRATSLSLNGLGLTALPDSVGSLTNVTELDLRGSRLTTFPSTLAKIRLSGLDLERNPHTPAIKAAYREGHDTLGAFLAGQRLSLDS